MMLMLITLAGALASAPSPQLHCDSFDMSIVVKTLMRKTARLYPENRDKLEAQLNEVLHTQSTDKAAACIQVSAVRNSLARLEGPRVLNPLVPDPLLRLGTATFCTNADEAGPLIAKAVEKNLKVLYPQARQQLQALVREAAQSPYSSCALYEETRNYLIDLDLQVAR